MPDLHGDVCAKRVVDGRCILPHGFKRVEDWGERVVIDRDALQRILGRRRVLGHHHGKGLPDVTDLALGQQGMFGSVQRIHGALAEHLSCGDIRQGAGDVDPGQDGGHAGPLTGCRDVYRPNAGMRIEAPQHRGVQHAWQRDIPDESTVAGEQFGSFNPFDRLADVAHPVPPRP